ncbi:hypothetical protein [Cellvibrio mixtus]|uniref:hypothetical protein n=1 Tax=Cellvibrio mixtus TaxID=39650 RepID=UPI000586676F|nr:hypothetical protein [Cellvibrio mixtus]
MKSLTILKLLLIPFFLIALNAQAIIIEGGFRGTITSFLDGDEDKYDGYFDEDLLGTEVSGSFWYDVDKAPGSIRGTPTNQSYESYTNNWLTLVVNINGKVLSPSVEIKEPFWPSLLIEGVNYTNDDIGDGSNIEAIYLYEQNIYVYGDTPDYTTMGISLGIMNWGKHLLSGLGLVQELQWEAGPDTYGYVSIGMQDEHEIGRSKASAIDITLEEFFIRKRSVANVPESPSIYLLLIGALSLLYKRKHFILEK